MRMKVQMPKPKNALPDFSGSLGVSEEPSAPLSHRVPRTSRMPGRKVCLSVRILIIVRITASSLRRFQSPKRNGDPGVPGNSLASRSESYGERRILPEERREEERPVHSPEPLPAPGIHHSEAADEMSKRRLTVPLSQQYPKPSTCRGAVSQYPLRDFRGI